MAGLVEKAGVAQCLDVMQDKISCQVKVNTASKAFVSLPLTAVVIVEAHMVVGG
jgi:hypothetical protein